jgi:RNA polymerase sigma-70 factor (ECF subfamily)
MRAAATRTTDRDEIARTLQERFELDLAGHRGIVFKIANIYCRNTEDQRDLAQEIHTQLWRSYPSYDARRTFSTWMYQVALNVAISHRRRSSYRDRHLTSIDDAAMAAIPDPASFEPDDRVRELHRVIGQLDDFDRALVVLYLEGRTYRESAEVLGITETNVATKLNRIKERLRQEIGSPRA